MSSQSIVARPGPSRVVFNRSVGHGWYLLRLQEPQIAAAARPGQFVQIRCNDGCAFDPILRRPFSIYRVDRSEGTYDILYVTVGRGTRWMARVEGPPTAQARGADANPTDSTDDLVEALDVEGPFGNTFCPPAATDRVYLVGGSVGVAPLYFLAAELLSGESEAPHMTLCMGARTKELLQGLDDFRDLGLRCETATDDGSCGHHGFVTQLLEELLEEENEPDKVRLYGCGPQGMNDSLRRLAVERSIPCEICLESLMACGFGICFGCVAPIRREVDGEFQNRRICWEGPVFDARLLAPGIDGVSMAQGH